MKKIISRFFSMLLVICIIASMVPAAVFAAMPGVVYLKPNSEWLTDGARFAVYFFNNAGNIWVSMTDSDGDGYYEADVPSGYGSLIFCRMSYGSTDNGWSNVWNQTADLTLPNNGTNCWAMNSGDWSGGGVWSTYSNDYYLIGYINGADYGCEGDAANLGSYKFVNGTLTTTFTQDSYVFVKTGDNAKWYMASFYDQAATKQTLYTTANGGSEKLFVPGNVKVTFTLISNSDGTLTLSYTADTAGCAHASHDTDGNCTACGKLVGHTWAGGKCRICGTTCSHSWGSGVVTKTASCTASGVKTYTCSMCGNTKTESIEATGHNYASKVTAPTCTASGYTTYTCSKCGDSYTGNTTAATGHNYVNEICSKCGDGCSHSWGSGVVTKTASCTASGIKTYTCAKCGGSYTEAIAATGHSWSNGNCSACGTNCTHNYSDGKCTVCGMISNSITVHLVNTLGWAGTVAYAWEASTSTVLPGYEWPGQIAQRDANGYYTMTVDYTPVSGKSLGLLFHNFNGSQTADIVIDYAAMRSNSEFWIKPSTTANSDGKYSCTVSTTESGLVISPEINGRSVTFRYQNSRASAVYLAGTMNNWSTSANKMTKGANGVWSLTLTLTPGVYEYKFVVDGAWVLDPCNGVSGGYDGNSVMVVPSDDSTVNTGKVTVVLHFYRGSGNYNGWDVWFWDNEKSVSAAFQKLNGDKGMIATFTVNGGTNANVGYIIRKTDWSEKEFNDRFIDLSGIVSGEVHYYVNSGVYAGSRILGEDVVFCAKPSNANYQYDTGNVRIETGLPLSNPRASDFRVVDGSGNATNVAVTGVTLDGNGYLLTLSRGLNLSELNSFRLKYGSYDLTITLNTHDLFYSSGFAADYTYSGGDLGAVWSKRSTTFKVWAPTASAVSVKLYTSGNYGANDLIKQVAMMLGDKGVWNVTVPGDLNGVYYNYEVTVAGNTVEATDPYARATGANGDRGMVIDLSSTDPEGWENDRSPNQGMSYTDAIIYELHVREMTIDASSGVKDAWKGKYLGLTQSGTSYNGHSTGLEHLKELGVTHVQLMPVYDFNSVDEYHLTDWQQYAWGYDPKNYNVPEGSYSTDPFKGEVRIGEFKQMVQTFHKNGINVVMDVVYNHTFDGGTYCGNKIVPYYYSRFYGEGNWSNGSGCGNDFATERSMVRKYIVDSVLYWVEEYHIDGFRFDLSGLIDTVTMNEIMNTVHAKYPSVLFYGEGWSAGDTAVESGYDLTTQGNAWKVGDFGFFNDAIRNAIAGNNGTSWGFASGSGSLADAIGSYFRASNWFSTSPTQTINYVSCHDNYCLTDKIIISRNGAYWSEMAAMNRLSAAMVLMSQGVPFIYSGDEMLREKKDSSGNRYDNAYSAPDEVTKIYWSDLQNKQYAQVTDDYYAGLINFRKNHAALRCSNGSDAWHNTSYYKINDNCIMFYVSGSSNNECSDGIVIIFNGSANTQWVNVGNYGVPGGYWQACIHGDKAGITPLWGVDIGKGYGKVGVEGYSATVLVLGDLVDEESVYNKQSFDCDHIYHNTSGMCSDCGKSGIAHLYSKGVCVICGLAEDAPDTYTVYFDNSTTGWSSVNIYAWTTTCNNTLEYTGSWPGAAMTLVDAANGIYSFELPIGAANIIFSGNSERFDDLAAPGYTSNVTLFDPSTQGWVTYEKTCAHSYRGSVTTAAGCTTNGVRTYTCTACGDSYTEEITASGHSYVNGVCSVCGDKTETASLFTLAGVNVVLGGELDMNFFIDPANLSGTDYYAQVTLYAMDGAVTTIVPYDQWEQRTSYTVVTLKGLAARQMADNINIVIYHGNGVQASASHTDSIRSYVMRVLENQQAEAKTLLVDMLNYGAAAQTFFNYNTDDLANNQLSESQKNYATQSISYTDQRVKGTNYYGSSLTLKSKIMMTMYFRNITTAMYAMITFTDHKGNAHEIRVDGSEFSQYNSTVYGVVVDDLVVADGNQTVTVTVYDIDGNQIAYASDTVNSYAVRMLGEDVLYEMVMKFTTSAHAYFH